MDQRVVRPGDGGARAEQDQRVEQRELERIHHLDALGREQPLDRRQRGREQREIEEGPEPADEEHHFRGDEQDHAVAQVKLHDGRVIAGMRFLDHVAPPEEHRREHAEHAQEEDRAAMGRHRIRMHPAHRADRHDESRHRAHQRPEAGWQNMIIVVLGAGHKCSPYLSARIARLFSFGRPASQPDRRCSSR